jgi:hypothetical protein
MFISAKYLVSYYDIDHQIARFFVDRQPPCDNLYWHEKLLYLRPSPGYLFIPLIVDLLHKTGVDKELLLSDAFVTTMEQIGHITALEEIRKITEEEAIHKSLALVKDSCKNKTWLTDVTNYFNTEKDNSFEKLAPPFTALRRGDIFLFSLCSIQFPESLDEEIAAQWFSLISILLLLDDAEDIDVDRKNGDKNAFLESGLDQKGIDNILALVRKSLRKISQVNERMAEQLDVQFKGILQLPHIQTLLKQPL